MRLDMPHVPNSFPATMAGTDRGNLRVPQIREIDMNKFDAIEAASLRSDVPEFRAGDMLNVVDDEAKAREIAEEKARRPQIALPAVGAFTSPYGMRWGVMHAGIDIANAVGTPDADHGIGHLQQQTSAVLYRAAVPVGALVGHGGEELVEQVAVRGVDLHHLEPGVHGPSGGLCPGADELLHALVGQGARVAAQIGQLAADGLSKISSGHGIPQKSSLLGNLDVL